MSKVNSATGTQDFLGHSLRVRNYIKNAFNEVAKSLNIQDIQTPVLERVETFVKNLGESSDIVQKEMFFVGEDMVLRPEGTAGIVRSLISNGWQELLPLKVAYSGSMFRKERPQKGRFREFEQLGVEFLGFDSTWGDGLAIQSATLFLSKINLLDKVELQYNFLGEEAERLAYREALVKYLAQFEDKLSEESKQRLKLNPLRVLDSKQKEDQDIVANAPSLETFYSPETIEKRQAFEKVLSQLNINGTYNPRMVRGLDYYNGLVFEFISNEIGAQSTVIGGGRYDRLVEQMGGPKTPSIGWAAGLERLSYLVTPKEEAKQLLIGIVVVDSKYIPEALALSNVLSREGFAVELATNDSMGKKMKRLNKLGANFAVILGENEINNGEYTFKDMTSGEQKTASTLEGLITFLWIKNA